MGGSFPAFPQSRFPNDLPPTLFSPASPKVKPAKPTKEVEDLDTDSIVSTGTFSSKVSLLKDSVKAKFSSSHKTESEKPSKSLPKDSKTPRQRTSEAYMYVAQFK